MKTIRYDLLRVGVLALQGDFAAHLSMLQKCGAQAREVRTVQQLHEVDGLIIPGGESTTIIKLMQRYGLDEAIRQRVAQGMPLFGTCAGLIVMSTDIEGYPHQPRLGVLNVSVARNAFGRQVDSFEVDLPIARLGDPPMRAVFIRAPYITRTGEGVETLAQLDGKVVLVQQRNLLAGAFHPELTEDQRLHRYFLQMVASHKSAQ